MEDPTIRAPGALEADEEGIRDPLAPKGSVAAEGDEHDGSRPGQAPLGPHGLGVAAQEELHDVYGLNGKDVLLGLLGGFQGVVSLVLLQAYLANRGNLQGAGDRMFSPSTHTIESLMHILKIDASHEADLVAKGRAIGHAAGEFLQAIADAKAGT